MRSFAGAAVATSLLAFGAASAQTVDPTLLATRRGLIEQARAARSANDHARSFDLAQRAGQIEMSLSLRRFVAEEQESLGRVADAMNSAELCLREASAAPRDHARESAPHVDACRAMTGRLASRVGRVTVLVPTPPPDGLRVRVAGSEVPAVVWGVPVLVTPGSVAVDVESPTTHTFHRDVTVAAGATASVQVALEALPPVVAPPVVTPVVVAPPPPVVAPAQAPPVVAPSASPSAGPFVLMGVGVLGLGAMATFLALQAGDSGEPCADNPMETCTSARADTYGTVAWVSLGVGASAAIGGLVWFLVDRSSHAAPARASLTGAPLPGGGTLGLRLTF